MKFYIIAGEPSGDLHASKLVKALKKRNSHLKIRAWGGDLMKKEGAKIVKHYRDTAFMGFLTVAKNWKTILKNIKFCKEDIAKWKPDVLILVDYPGFNLKIAKYANTINIKVLYYISPKVWAWKKWRVKTIKKYVDKMYVIFPFEKDFYQRYKYKVYYIGNPVVQTIDDYLQKKIKNTTINKQYNLSGKPIIALLPGSRKQEIASMLPIFTKLTRYFQNYDFVVAATSSFSKDFYSQFMKNHKLKLVFDNTYTLLYHAEVAVVASGTATLETALLNTPQLVVYRQMGGIVVEKIAKLVYPHYFSLVNIILKKQVVKELFMTKVTCRNIKKELSKILYNEKYQKTMLTNYKELRDELGMTNAAKKAAELIYEHIA